MNIDIENLVDDSFDNINNEPAERDPVEQAFDDEFGTDEQRFKRSAFVAKDSDPDVAAEAYSLSKKYKAPAHFIERNIELFRDEEKPDPLNYSKITKESKVLGKALEDPIFASMSKDDTEVLSKILNSVSSIKHAERSFAADLGEAANVGVKNLSVASFHGAAALGIRDIEDVAEDIARINSEIAQTQNSLPDYAVEFNKALEGPNRDIDKALSKFWAGYEKAADGKIIDGLADYYSGAGQSVYEFANMIYQFTTRPKAASRLITENLALAFPSIALGVAGAKTGAAIGTVVAPGPGTAVGGVSGFVAGSAAGSTGTEFGAWINSALSERGYDITSKDDILKAYTNKELMSEIRDEATRKGITTAAVDTMFNAFGGRFLKGAAGKGIGAKTAGAAKDVAVQSVGEASSELAGQVAAREGDLSKVSVGDAVLEGLSSFGQSVADTAIGSGIRKVSDLKADKSETKNNSESSAPSVDIRGEFSENTTVASKEIAEKTLIARQSLEEIGELAKLGELVEQSNLKKRSPEAFAELIDKVTPENEIQSVYFQSDDWKNMWRELGISPVEKAEQLLSLDSYNESQENGTDINVPLKELLSKVESKEEYEMLLKIAKTQPEGMKLEESSEFAKKLPELMGQMVQEAQEFRTKKQADEQEFSRLTQDLNNQLRDAGANKQSGLFIREAYKSFAERSGLTPAEVAKQFPLTINQELQADTLNIQEEYIETFNQDDLKIHREDAIDLANKAVNRELKLVGQGGENDVFDAGNFVAKTITKKEFIAGRGNAKRFLIESVLEDNGLSEKQIRVETSSGDIVLLQKKQTTFDQAIKKALSRMPDDDFKKYESNLYKRRDELVEKAKELGFFPNDLHTENLSVDSKGNVYIIDAGTFNLDLTRGSSYRKEKISKINSSIKTLKYVYNKFKKENKGDKEALQKAKLLHKKRIEELNNEKDELKRKNPVALTLKERQSAREKIIKETDRSGKTFFQNKKETQADRKARAEALGFDTSNVLLHGTPDKKFTEFKPSTNLRSGPGVYFFSDKENHHAHNYTGESGRVIEAYVKRGKYFEKNNNSQDNFIKVMNDLGYDPQPWIDRNEEKRAESVERSRVSAEKTQQRRVDKGLEPLTEKQIESLVNQSTIFDEFDVVDFERAIRLANGDNKKVDIYSLLEDAGYLGVIDELNGDPVQTVFDPKNIRSVDAKFDPSNSDYANIFAQKNRGEIQIFNDKFNINLFETADASTIIHESGHYFLELMDRISSMEGANDELKNDYQIIRDWLGVADGEKFTTEHHEKYARGFELYVREGKSPSEVLRRVFNTFKTWLVNIYRSASELNVEINDDVRSVFDRMLTSKDEIKSEMDAIPEFRISEVMPPAMQERYFNAQQEAQVYAEEELSKELMSFDDKLKKKKWQIIKKQIKAEVTKEINTVEVYNNISILSSGKFADGKPLEPGTPKVKLSLSESKDKYPEIIDHPNFKGTFSNTDGISLDVVSGVLGYENSFEMIEDIKSVPEKKVAIKMMTEQRLKEKGEDLLSSPNLETEARRLVHGDQLKKMVRMEYEYLSSNDPSLVKDITKQVVKRPASKKQVKAQAERSIEKVLVGQMKPHQFKLAFNRHRKTSGEHLVKGDVIASFDSKEKELLNLELYGNALEANQFIKKKEKDVKKFFKKDQDLAKTRDMDLINAGRAILARYGLGRLDKEPLQYLEKLKEYSPESYEHMSAIISGVLDSPDNYKNISYGQFKDLIGVVQALWDLSKDTKSITVKGEKHTVEKAVEELQLASDRFRSDKKSKDEYERTPNKWDKFKSGLLGIKAYLRRFEHWVDVMDMGDVRGPFRKFLFEATSDATSEFLETNKRYKKRFVDLSEDIKKTFKLGDEIKSPELGFAFRDKSEVLGALLHTGNPSNKKKLLVGRGWAQLNEDGSLNTSKWDSFIERAHRDGILTKADYDYVQSLWDLMEEIKPLAQRSHKKIFGFFFDEITSEQIDTPFGSYRGGYAPAKVDPFAVKDITRRAELEAFIKSNPSFSYPASGGRGFTKGRVDNFNKPLNIDVGLVGKHIEDVLKFSIIKPAVVDAAKVLMNEDFKASINSIDNQVIDKMIKPALNRADKNTISVTDPSAPALAKKFGSLIKSNASLQLMFANVINVAEQVGGFGIAATKVGPRSLMKAGYRYLSNPKKINEQVSESSQAMRVRFDDQIFEIERTAQDIFSEKSSLGKMRDWAQKHAYFMQVYVQNVMDNIIWSASYDEAVSKGLSHKDSVTKADSDVRTTQSSRRPIDISNLETNATLGFFQMFMNFFNMMANVNTSNFTKLYYEDIGMTQKYAKGFYLYMMGFASVAIVSESIRKAAAGGVDEDEDGEYIDDLFDVFIGSQIDLGLAMAPIVGQGVNAGINQANDKFYDDRVSASPAVSALTTVFGVASKGAAGKLTDDKGVKSDVRDAMTALGILTGLPIRPLSKPIGYLIDVEEGKARPKGALDFTRGLVTGKKGVD